MGVRFNSVKSKFILIFFISLIFVITFTSSIFNFVVFRYIDKIENKDLDNNFEVIDSIINREEWNMKKICLDWAHWDDTYSFMEGNNKEAYIESNFQESALKEVSLNFMFFTDTQGNIVYSNTNELESSTKDLLEKKFLNKSSKFNRLITSKSNDEVHSGILNISGKMFIITASNVTTTDEKSKSNGSLVMGRYIDKSLIDYINSITKCKVQILPLTNSRNIRNNTIKKDNNSITAYRQIKDINGDISIVYSISMLRDEYNLGKAYLKIFGSIFLVALILTCFTASFIINKYILNRLKVVNDFIDTVSSTKNIEASLDISGNDEITNIANSTNNMLLALNFAHKDILNLSYSDKLTGLKNRLYIEEKFYKLDDDSSSNYSIVMGDVNGLKLVNDTFGHKEGDRLIYIIANILKSMCAKDDIVARWGGDEFIILIENKEYSYVLNLVKSIKNKCEEISDFSFKISIALGSAGKSERTDWETVMNLAEERMYRSKLTEKTSSRNGTIKSLEKTLYEKHSETEEHTERVKKFSMKLGKKLKLFQDELDELELLSLLHDIGKIGIPEQILMKPGRLTAEEWEIMKTHTDIGYRIAKATPELSHVANEILYHHEKFDGTGYPQGLKWEEIPILSRIINVVDSFDVMTHKRTYKDANDVNYAVEELKRCSSTQFDPAIVEEFISLLEEENYMLINRDN